MKRTFAVVCLLGLLGLLVEVQPTRAQEPAAEPAPKADELKTVKQKVSYGFGLDIGRNLGANLSRQGIDVDPQALMQGIADALGDKKSRLSEEELEAALKTFQKDLQAKARKSRDEIAQKRIDADPVLKAQAEKNTQEGAAFLTANKAKEGVKTTASGLQYQVIKEGEGEKPAESDVVKTHYHGTLPGGDVFDSSVERKEPAVFTVDGVIAGWTEALQLMKVGSKWKLFVPSELAYGLSGSGEKIGPNQVLVFEVELLSIETPKQNPPE